MAGLREDITRLSVAELFRMCDDGMNIVHCSEPGAEQTFIRDVEAIRELVRREIRRRVKEAKLHTAEGMKFGDGPVKNTTQLAKCVGCENWDDECILAECDKGDDADVVKIGAIHVERVGKALPDSFVATKSAELAAVTEESPGFRPGNMAEVCKGFKVPKPKLPAGLRANGPKCRGCPNAKDGICTLGYCDRPSNVIWEKEHEEKKPEVSTPVSTPVCTTVCTTTPTKQVRSGNYDDPDLQGKQDRRIEKIFRAEELIAARPGITTKEIATRLGMSPQSADLVMKEPYITKRVDYAMVGGAKHYTLKPAGAAS
jgi:hypothetical protein